MLGSSSFILNLEAGCSLPPWRNSSWTLLQALGEKDLKCLKNYPFWKGQWVCQLSSHRPSAVRVPASAPGHTPQLSCSAQLRPHLSLGCLDAAGGHPGESYLQVYKQCLTALVTWGSRRGRIGLYWPGECLRLAQVPALQLAWACLTYPKPYGLATSR